MPAVPPRSGIPMTVVPRRESARSGGRQVDAAHHPRSCRRPAPVRRDPACPARHLDRAAALPPEPHGRRRVLTRQRYARSRPAWTTRLTERARDLMPVLGERPAGATSGPGPPARRRVRRRRGRSSASPPASCAPRPTPVARWSSPSSATARRPSTTCWTATPTASRSRCDCAAPEAEAAWPGRSTTGSGPSVPTGSRGHLTITGDRALAETLLDALTTAAAAAESGASAAVA